MPMAELRVGDQTVRYDREATAAIYGTLKQGGAEKCVASAAGISRCSEV
jgi:hypothetical protein